MKLVILRVVAVLYKISNSQSGGCTLMKLVILRVVAANLLDE